MDTHCAALIIPKGARVGASVAPLTFGLTMRNIDIFGGGWGRRFAMCAPAANGLTMRVERVRGAKGAAFCPYPYI